VEGVVLNQNVVVAAGGPTRMEKAKIAIIQFQLSAPKPDVGVSPPFHFNFSSLSLHTDG
jgi:chaperonin GroEL (HSP60 family)